VTEPARPAETAPAEAAGPAGPWPDIAAGYDRLASHYADRFGTELDGKPADRALLDRFAAEVAGRGPVWDVGCGPAGHVTAYLARRGVAASGADLSPGAVAEARRRHPGLDFRVADMLRLPAADGSLAGIVAFYSVIHLPRPQIPAVLAEFRRVLAPGGSLLLAMHPGAGERGSADALGQGVALRMTLVTLAEITALVEAAGLAVGWSQAREPYPGEVTPRLYLWARFPR
jgi:SAM-dependent methyltransferase